MNEYIYTLDDVIRKLKNRNMYVPSIPALTTLMTKHNFYSRGFATKEPNGYKNGEVTGKKWYLSNEGVEILIELTKGIRHRKTKAEMQESRKVEQLEIGKSTFTFNDDGSMSYKPMGAVAYEPFTPAKVYLRTWLDTQLNDYISLKSKLYDMDFTTTLESIIREDMNRAFPDIPKR